MADVEGALSRPRSVLRFLRCTKQKKVIQLASYRILPVGLQILYAQSPKMWISIIRNVCTYVLHFCHVTDSNRMNYLSSIRSTRVKHIRTFRPRRPSSAGLTVSPVSPADEGLRGRNVLVYYVRILLKQFIHLLYFALPFSTTPTSSMSAKEPSATR